MTRGILKPKGSIEEEHNLTPLPTSTFLTSHKILGRKAMAWCGLLQVNGAVRKR